MVTHKEAGKKGAQKRNENLGQKGRSEVAKKAAQTRLKNNPDALSEIGKKGAKTRHADPVKSAQITAKAVATRLRNDPDAFKKMGKKGADTRYKNRESTKKD